MKLRSDCLMFLLYSFLHVKHQQDYRLNHMHWQYTCYVWLDPRLFLMQVVLSPPHMLSDGSFELALTFFGAVSLTRTIKKSVAIFLSDLPATWFTKLTVWKVPLSPLPAPAEIMILWANDHRLMYPNHQSYDISWKSIYKSNNLILQLQGFQEISMPYHRYLPPNTTYNFPPSTTKSGISSSGLAWP